MNIHGVSMYHRDMTILHKKLLLNVSDHCDILYIRLFSQNCVNHFGYYILFAHNIQL